MIKFIYFDLGKVILDFDHEIGCQNVAELTGVSSEEARGIIFDSGLQDQYETGLIDCAEFHKTFCEHSKTNPDQKELLSAISRIFTPKREIFPLISQLAAVRFPIGILSNTCKAHWDSETGNYPTLNELFGAKILSFEVQSMKPDAKIYEAAIRESGFQPAECFFVDDKQENVDGAIAAGMDAVQFVSGPELLRELFKRKVPIG